MAFFRNFGVTRRDSLCGVLSYASAQSLDFLELAQKFSFLDWKLAGVPNSFLDGHKVGNSGEAPQDDMPPPGIETSRPPLTSETTVLDYVQKIA
jgi:hypothetical protein